MVKLKGMTWNHVRGYAPLLAVTELFREQHPECDMEWDRRSLKDFGDYPIDELANEYDIILIDHPHVGISAAKGVLVPLDAYIPAEYLQEQEANSIGPSHQSYQWGGHQWALAVDAAAQVASYRPDLIDAADVPRSWQQLLELTKSLPKGRKVGWPLCPTDAMCSFLTLCASIRGKGFFDEAKGIPAVIGEAALERMFELLPLLHESSISSNPIQMYDHMGSQDDIVFIPLGFGYSNYAREGFAPHLLRFTDIPTASGEPRGSLLGGVGMAVSAFSAQIPLAVQFAMYAASEAVQRTVYVEIGGQPGHGSAWRDEEVNRYCHRFFADTQRTLELSYMRPRNQAFPTFQEEAGVLLHAALRRRLAGETVDGAQTITEINRCYERNWRKLSCE
jgi:multiple sugar transport system substrate-binding protein